MLTSNEIECAAAEDSIEFELNPIIIGMLAREYAGTDPNAPQRSWGGEMSNRTIHWRGDGYVFGKSRLGKRVGIGLTVTKNQLNGGKEQERFWIPIEALECVKVTIPAVRL